MLNLQKSLDHKKRILLTCRFVCLFFAVGVLMSYNLWTSDRFFPLLPLFDAMPVLKHPLDVILLILFIVVVVLGIVRPKPVVFLLVFGILGFYLVQDQCRWQPWVYVYAMFLLPFAKKEPGKASMSLVNYFQIILIGVYVWSGLQKFNPNFIEFTFKRILTELLTIESNSLVNSLSTLGYSIPVVEVLIGLCLVFPRSRNMGVYMALTTHIFILIYLSPLGINYNSIVYPWNFAMMTLVLLAFFKNDQPLFTWCKESIGSKIPYFLVALLTWILPVLNLFGKWDHYLSFSLYSDKPHEFYIAVEESSLGQLPGNYKPYFVSLEGMTGGRLIDVNKWSVEELNVPFYPETRVFKILSANFCTYGIPGDHLIFLEFEKPIHNGKFYSYQCKDLGF